METAIHKETGKYVTPFKLTRELEWHGKERDEFIAPYHEIGNWLELNQKGINEVKVSFVKEHIRNEQILVHSHFRIVTEGAVENPENESEEHKLAKNKIYLELINDTLKVKVASLGEKKISELGEIEDILIERGAGKKRADVLVKFKEFNAIYGNGIAFEVQISKQNVDKTIERSFDRASYGYSVVWVWSDDIETKNYELTPYTEALELYKKKKDIEFSSKIDEISNKFDYALVKFGKILSKDLEKYELVRAKLKEDIKQATDNFDFIVKQIGHNNYKEIEEIFKKKISEIDLNGFFIQSTNKFVEEKADYYLSCNQGIFNEKVNNIIFAKLNSLIDNNLIKESISNGLNLKLSPEVIKKELLEQGKEYFKKAKDNLEKEQITLINSDIKEIANKIIVQKIEDVGKDYLNILKAENLMDYFKNKTSLYLECPECKQEKTIMVFKFDKDKKFICQNCLEVKAGEKSKDTIS